MMKLTILTLLLSFLSGPSYAALIFHQDWEDGGTGSSSEGFYPEQACCDHSITNVTTRAYSGTHSTRYLVEQGDPPVDGHTGRATSSIRSGTAINGKAVLPYDQDRWYGFAIYVPSNSNMMDVNIFNTHTHNWGAGGCSVSGASSPISFRVRGPSFPRSDTDYHWALLTYPAGVNGAPPDREVVFEVDATDDIGEWTEFVFHINLSYSDPGPGLLEIWKNGVSIHQDLNFTLDEYPVPQYCGEFFPKIGASTAGTAGYPLEAFHDAMRWGDENSSYAEVDPAQSSTTTPPEDDPLPTSDTIEAETGKLSGTMVILLDSSASDGRYTRTKGIGEGVAEFTVNAETAGSYNFEGRVYVWGEDNDTLFVSVDNGQEQKWDLNIGYQKWTDVTYPFTFDLSKGTHTIRFRGENDSARLDYFTIKNVQSQVISSPAGFQIVQ